MKPFRMDNTEGFTEEQLEKLNEQYREEARLLDSTSDNYDQDIKNLQDRMLNNFHNEQYQKIKEPLIDSICNKYKHE